MAAIRALWTQAYGSMTMLVTGDNQIFVKNFPKFIASPSRKPAPFQPAGLAGRLGKGGTNYTQRISYNGEDKCARSR